MSRIVVIETKDGNNHNAAIAKEVDFLEKRGWIVKSASTCFNPSFKVTTVLFQKEEDPRTRLYDESISILNPSIRVEKGLAKIGVKTIGDLMKKSEFELLQIPNFGRTCMRELKAKLWSNWELKLPKESK